MATSTFDKSFIVTKPDDQERIWAVLESDEPARPIEGTPYSVEERERTAELLHGFLQASLSDRN